MTPTTPFPRLRCRFRRISLAFAAFVLCLGAVVSTRPLFGAAQPGDFDYTSANGAITITKYHGLGGAVEIPGMIDGLPVTGIQYYAFYGCTTLSSVAFPSSVCTIGDAAFQQCTNLTSINFSPNLTSLGVAAFAGCTSLTSIAIPPKLTSVPDTGFAGCTSLTSITFHDKVTSLEYSAFSGCTSLTQITLPSMLGSIKDWAIAGCTSLTTLRLPAAVQQIGFRSFTGCSSLKSISVDALNPAYSSVDGVLFDKHLTTLIQFPSGKSGAFSIPSGVTDILYYAFADASGLTSVTIPATVTSMQFYAFVNCTSLEKVYFQGSPPSTDYSFVGDYNAALYYLAGSSGWGAYFSGLPTVAIAASTQLAQLTLGEGMLVPGFDPDITGYNLTSANSVLGTSVTATGMDSKATISARINGGKFFALVSGSASGIMALKPGANLIDVKVTAWDGATSETYSIGVYRVAPPVSKATTNIGSDSATLNALVEGSSFAFQYGLTTNYGKITAPQSIVSGTGPQAVSANISGLIPATLYHARLAVTTGTVTDQDNDFTFVTAQATPSDTVAAEGQHGVLGSEDPGSSFLSFGTPGLNDSDNVAFQAVISGSSGSGITGANNSGIWLFSGSDRRVIARTGNSAPGGGMFAILGDPVLNARDELAFLGSVSGIGFSAKNSLGIWTTASGSSASLHLVARAQGQPLDPSGVKASAFSQIVLQDTGSVVFLATLVNGVGGANSKNNQGIWTEINGQLQPVLRKGDVLAGGTVSALSLFGFPLAPAGVGGQTRNFNRNGGLSFKATFVDGTQSIFVLTSGTELTQVVKTGSSAPPIFGVPSTFLSLGNPILNDRGNTAFQAFVSGTAKGAAKYSAILSESGSGHDLRVIALTGSFAPDANGVKGGNGLFSALGDPVFNCNDQIAFIGKLTTGGGVTAADNQGIWASTSGTLAMVARTQGQAPGCPVGTKFLSFIQLVLPDQGGVVFVANLTGAMGGIKATNNQGIWAVDTAGNLRLVARTGDTLMINGVPKIISSLSLFRTSVGTAGQTRGFNGAGDLIYRATFTDKTQSIQKVVFP